MVIGIIVMFLFFGSSVRCERYNRSALLKKYPELRKDFVAFPNEDSSGGVTFGYLTPPSRIRSLGVKTYNVDVDEYITFTFYSRKYLEGIEFKHYKDLPEDFDKSKKTKFLTHGWLASGKSQSCVLIKEAFLYKFDVNVIVVDWSPIAKNINYLLPMQLTANVGESYAKFLNYLVNDIGVDPKDIHLIGHSLGAHVSGFAARRLENGKIARITGLDPALPGFALGFAVRGGRLKKEDADFVDIIHTCAGFLGLFDPIGSVDFYPNRGLPPQPGCSILEFIEACSHGRSYQLFTLSIVNDKQYMAKRCDSLQILEDGVCRGDMTPMGESTPSNATGIYYIETTINRPFNNFTNLIKNN